MTAFSQIPLGLNGGLDYTKFTPASIGFSPGMGSAGMNAAAGAAQANNPLAISAPPGVGGGAPGAGSFSDLFKGTGLGMNMGTAQLALGGLQTIAGIWGAWQANKLAKDQLNFQKGVVNTNLANQVQAYNTQLDDRARSRAHTQNQDPSTADAYIAKHSLRRTQI